MSLRRALSAFQSPKTANHKIFRAAVIVATCSLGVKVVATFREATVARVFGRGDAVDAFILAYLVPSYFVAILAGSLNQALVPTYVQVRDTKGQKAADRLFTSVLLQSTGLLCSVCLALAVLGRLILPHLASGFSPEKLALTLHLYYAILPIVIIGGVSAHCSSVLNAERRFAFAAFTPIITPIVTTAGVLSLAPVFGPWVLACGIVSGAFLECSVLVLLLKTYNIRLTLGEPFTESGLVQVRKQYLPLIVAGVLGSGAIVIDQAMAAMLSPGSVAALNYGNKIISVVLNLMSISLTTAAIPYLSEMAAAENWSGCRRTLNTYSKLLLGLSIPLTLLLILGSRLIVRVLLQRGAFTAADATIVAHVQAMYALQMPFFAVNILIVRVLTVMKRNDIIMYSAGLNLVLDVILNLVCMRFFGVAGIALSTSLFYVASFFVMGTAVHVLLQRAEKNSSNLASAAAFGSAS